MTNRTLISFASLFLFGCSTYMEQVVYKPAPATYQEWSKYGASILDIKKSLLECGKPAPDISFEIYEKAFNISRYDELAYINKLEFENICMERSGYKYNGTYNTKKICLLEKYKNLPACQPDIITHTPSVERRLNSWYCKTRTDYNYCLKYALAPQLCSLEKTQNPPPECLANDQNHPSDAKRINALEADSSAKYADDHEDNGLMRLWFPGLYQPYTMSPQSQEYMRRVLDQQRLQQNIQNQNNSQMNQLLINTTPTARR